MRTSTVSAARRPLVNRPHIDRRQAPTAATNEFPHRHLLQCIFDEEKTPSISLRLNVCLVLHVHQPSLISSSQMAGDLTSVLYVLTVRCKEFLHLCMWVCVFTWVTSGAGLAFDSAQSMGTKKRPPFAFLTIKYPSIRTGVYRPQPTLSLSVKKAIFLLTHTLTWVLAKWKHHFSGLDSSWKEAGRRLEVALLLTFLSTSDECLSVELKRSIFPSLAWVWYIYLSHWFPLPANRGRDVLCWRGFFPLGRVP